MNYTLELYNEQSTKTNIKVKRVVGQEGDEEYDKEDLMMLPGSKRLYKGKCDFNRASLVRDKVPLIPNQYLVVESQFSSVPSKGVIGRMHMYYNVVFFNPTRIYLSKNRCEGNDGTSNDEYLTDDEFKLFKKSFFAKYSGGGNIRNELYSPRTDVLKIIGYESKPIEFFLGEVRASFAPLRFSREETVLVRKKEIVRLRAEAPEYVPLSSRDPKIFSEVSSPRSFVSLNYNAPVDASEGKLFFPGTNKEITNKRLKKIYSVPNVLARVKKVKYIPRPLLVMEGSDIPGILVNLPQDTVNLGVAMRILFFNPKFDFTIYDV